MLDFSWLSSVSPEDAKLVFLGLFILIGLLIIRIPADYVWRGVERRCWWMNLKLWSILVLGTIFTTYLIF